MSNLNWSLNSALFITQYTGWAISSVPTFIWYKIFYTQTMLVIIVFRDCNSNTFNDLKRFFESET